MATYRLMDGAAGRPGDGPDMPVTYDGPFGSAVVFTVTAGATYFEGYWWWVCPDPDSTGTSQSTSPQEFSLWCLSTDSSGAAAGTRLPDSLVKSGILSAGWNFVPLEAPISLAPYASYVAQTGYSGPFPATGGQFSNNGISNGPLLAYSDQDGSPASPAGLGVGQGLFSSQSTAGDPTAAVDLQAYESTNFWIDVQVTDVAPAEASYRLWPNYPVIFTDGGGANTDYFAQTFGVEFTLSQPCTLDNIWYYSPADVRPDASADDPYTPSAVALPTLCGIFSVATRQVVAGTLQGSPSGSAAWSGAAGSGWVACSYSGVVLPPGDYKACVYTSGGWSNFYLETHNYWGAESAAVPASAVTVPASIVAGPLTGLSQAAAAQGQVTFHHDTDGEAGFFYPATCQFPGQNRWIDVEVTPVKSGGSLLMLFFP